MRILVVDDDEATRLCLVKVLEPAGEVASAANGAEALARFGEALEQGRPFGVVCMDLNMPRLGGQQTLKAMRDMEGRHQVPPGQEAKVVMVSACADTANVVEAYFGGQADGFVSKPLRLSAFKDELRKVGCRLP